MTQAELNEAVAEATGESVRTIRRRGFSVVTPLQVVDPDEDDSHIFPNLVYWDALERQRRGFAA